MGSTPRSELPGQSSPVRARRRARRADAIFVGMAHNPLVEQWCEALVARDPRLHTHRPRHLGAPL